jgi:IS30 family transposase
MRNNLTSTEIRVKSDVCTTPLFENKDFLTQKYVIEGLSARQIAVLIGCSHSTINNALIRYGIQKQIRKSGWIELGFRLSNGLRVPHVREQNLLERMRHRKVQGWSNAKISAWLNDQNIPSPSGKSQWYPATIGRLLRPV